MGLVIIFTVLALVHFYWAAGGTKGLRQVLPADLSGNFLLHPNKIETYGVGGILMVFSFVAYSLQRGIPPVWAIYAGWIVALLFVLRGVGDFNMVGLFKKIKGTSFAKYDTWVYVPLSFAIALYFIIILAAV